VSAKVTIITPTYNKPDYFIECAKSVLDQTYQDWVWWVVYNFDYGTINPKYWDICADDSRILPIYYPMLPEFRPLRHWPARIVNWLYPKVQTPYIYFLADDDLIDRDGLGVLVKEAKPQKRLVPERGDFGFGPSIELSKPQYDAVYGRCEVQNEQPDGTFKTGCWCYDGQDVGLNTSIDPDCRLDGGQVLHTKALWDRCTADGWQLSDKKEDAGHNDGQLLSRLAQFATFHYVPQRICTHRRTHLSSFHKPQL